MSENTRLELASLILNVVTQIPYGKVASYGQVARLAGLPKHARLVGRVLGRLENDHDIPWHRVINTQGKISHQSFNGQGVNIQQQKLIEEGIEVNGGKVNLMFYQWQP